MRLSVITVCFNASETIRDTLESVAAQAYSNVEHIIIDGLSTDTTLQIVSEFPHVATVVSERDDGLYDAMNKGVKLATGDIVGWLNADDMFAGPHTASRLVAAAQQGRPIIAGSVDMVAAHDVAKVLRRYSTKGFEPKWLEYGYAPPHPGLYVRREVLDRTGGYDLRYPLTADFDFISRAILREGFEYTLLDDIVVRMRSGGASSGILSTIRMYNEMYVSCRRNGISTGRVKMLKRYLHKALQYLGRQ